MRCRCRLVKSAPSTNFQSGSILGMAIFGSFPPLQCPRVFHLLPCLHLLRDTLSRGRMQGLEMLYQKNSGLWEFEVMGVIFCKLIQFISADIKGVVLVKKGKMLSSLFYSQGSHCSLVLSGHLNSLHIYWETVDFEWLLSSFSLISGKMEHFFACLTGPSADIAGGHVLVLINSLH